MPWISATTDEALFFPPQGSPDTFAVPGVLYQAFPFDPDTAARLATSSFHNVCTAGPVETYDDGVFVGHIQTFRACNGSASSIVRVMANPADQAFTADLLVQLTGLPDDAATLNGLLLSFNRVTPGTAPTTTVTVGGPSSTAATSSDPLIAQVQHQLLGSLGLTVTEEQATCVLDSLLENDPNGPAATSSALADCGVDVSNLSSG
jgi:hypothetical protein